MPNRAPRQRTANTASQPQLRCFCSSHKCGSEYDPETGLYGTVVDSRVYRSHQDADKAAELHHRAETARSNALTAQAEMITNALDALSLEPPAATPPPETQRYKIDGIKRTVCQISEIKDSIEVMNQTLHSIGSAPSNSVSPQAVQDALARLSDISEEASQQHRQLSTSGHGAYRKVDAVKILYHETKEEYKSLVQGSKSYEDSWKAVERQHRAEHEAFLASGGTEFDSNSHFVQIFDGVKAVLQIVILMVVACSVVLGLPRRGSYWLFSMTEFVVQTTVAKFYDVNNFPPYFSQLLRGFPRDIRTATEHFQIDGKSTVLAACPKCHTTYAPEVIDDIPKYRERCNSHEYGSRCGELLVRPKLVRRHRVFVPIKPYISFDMKDWMAGLLSRRGNETKMDAAWERMNPSDGILSDIFQGSVIREFKGPDKRTHFSCSGGGNAGRYLFSLGADFFNPLRNLTAGKKVSIGIIALVCLNLPIELRYLPENMFLAGIIPGPHEPSLSAVNHYLRPLIDVLLLFWTGILFSKTALYPAGRLILCAIIAIVCDLPAARKFGGFAGHHHEFFCSTCWCNKTEHTFDDFDYQSWKRRTNEECRTHAESFRSATTAKEAASSFGRTGIRWSELLRLPYFDPTKMLVVDPMHNLFLGLIKEHFQNILGYRPKPKDWLTNDGPSRRLHIPLTQNNPLPPGKGERASIRRLTSFLAAPLPITPENTFDKLVMKLGGPKSNIHVSAFVYVARGLGCIASTIDFTGRDTSLPGWPHPPPALKKKELANMVLSWRQQREEVQEERTLDDMRGRIFTEEEMEELWGDLERVVKPSWVSSVPSSISSICPKLKSDQWRTVGALYLPVTLIRLWSGLDLQDEQHEERRRLLHLTMLLCSAISVATSRFTSESHAKQFLAHMTEYRKELRRLFPAYECHPNHHIAFHITELLTMYGPVHGWWTFPFERMIGMLQRIRTNYKEGEYEATIARSWTRSSNFRAFFAKTTCPQPIRLCYEMFTTLVQPQTRNSLSLSLAIEEDGELPDSEVLDADNQPIFEDPISSDILAAFARVLPAGAVIPVKGKFVNRTICQGITYATRTIHEGNSGILRRNSEVPFSIENILEFPTVENGGPVQGFWLVVRRYNTVQIGQDPYLRYPLLRAKMWAPELDPKLEVFPMTDVDGHFAKCVIDWKEQEVVVVVSLSRVQEVE